MKAAYTATATAKGGRDGHIESSDDILDIDVRTPKALGGSGGPFTNPEQLFAAGYAACFNSALNLAARMKRLRIGEARVRVTIGIGKDDTDHFQLSALIEANVPDVSLEEARTLIQEAHEICPYSRATRGNIEVELRATNHAE